MYGAVKYIFNVIKEKSGEKSEIKTYKNTKHTIMNKEPVWLRYFLLYISFHEICILYEMVAPKGTYFHDCFGFICKN